MQAIILYSVGSPEVLSKQCIKQYLDRFLSDKNVVRIPGFLWQPILHSFILTTRPERMLKRYATIFNKDGSNPYLKMTEHLAQQLEDSLNPTLTAVTLSEAAANLGRSVFSISAQSQTPSLNQSQSLNQPQAQSLTPTQSSVKGLKLNQDLAPTTDLNLAPSSKPDQSLNKDADQDSTPGLDHNTVLAPNSDLASNSDLDSEASALALSTDLLGQNNYLVRCAYAYSQPSLTQVVTECINAGAKEIITIPLFPQYSDTTSRRPGLTLSKLQQLYPQCTFKLVRSYSAHEAYIRALTKLIKPYLEQAQAITTNLPNSDSTSTLTAAENSTQSTGSSNLTGLTDSSCASNSADSSNSTSSTTFISQTAGMNSTRPNAQSIPSLSTNATSNVNEDTSANTNAANADHATKTSANDSISAPHLLITYHSLPQSYIKLGDPYLKECQATTKALTAALGLSEKQYTVAYQSKLGPMTWLKPYIEDACHQLLRTHHTNLVVVAPGFSIDCLETLYDLGHGIKQQFLTQGGAYFSLVPCLNDSELQVNLLKELISTAQKISPANSQATQSSQKLSAAATSQNKSQH